MVRYAKGNMVFMKGSGQWDRGGGSSTSVVFELWGHRGASPSPDVTSVWQPGWFRGLNVHLEDNDNAIVTFTLHRRKYNGNITYAAETSIPILVIPSGGEGYFCMNAELFNDFDLRWEARDYIWMEMVKGSSGNDGIDGLTMAWILEIEEEYLLDNYFDTRPGNRPPLA